MKDDVTIGEMFKTNLDFYKKHIVAGKINNEIKSLDTKVNDGDKIDLIDITDKDGMKIYIRGLLFVIDVYKRQTSLLYNSTYDAVRAYQINTQNNNYSSEKTSRIRDITASVNSFFSSMATGLSSSGYTKTELNDYIPAILYNLYCLLYISFFTFLFFFFNFYF